MVTVQSVVPGSLAAKAGILPGDILLSVNGHEINDVLDYRFYLAEKKVTLTLHREAELLSFLIEKDEYEDIGLEFSSFLMDEKRNCRNGCVFCFIDQNPKGMRETIYFKDDDSRLSFLQGNYVTLTNMSDADLDRIIEMKMSPINISVHATDPALREKMMHNRFAGKILSQMRKLQAAGIGMNAQIVLCKGLNDGENLERTMDDLETLFPELQSVAIVPAGLTCHREGLYPLENFTPEESAAIIAQVDRRGKRCLRKYGSRCFYVADETYVRAGLPLPDPDYYEGYPQLDNGVGLMTSMREEFEAELCFLDEYDLSKERRLSIATGAAAYDYIRSLVEALREKVPTLDCRVYRIENDFFGHSVTVAGLVCGGDLLNQLRGKPLGDKLLLPAVMLRADGDLFLDGLSLAELREQLGVPVETVRNDGCDFIAALLGGNE